jgi:hypothetical protein
LLDDLNLNTKDQIMATKTGGNSTGGKVGSDPKARHDFGGNGDFGIPAHEEVLKEHESQIEGRPAGSAPGSTGTHGTRTTGVGSLGGEPGHDSGGDIDTDFIGFGATGGLAAKPPSVDEIGADEAGDPSKTFASGKPAKGRNSIKAHSHGNAPGFKGSTVDGSGDDTSTVNSESAGTVKAVNGNDNGSEGEVSLDEATGDVDQGAET